MWNGSFVVLDLTVFQTAAGRVHAMTQIARLSFIIFTTAMSVWRKHV